MRKNIKKRGNTSTITSRWQTSIPAKVRKQLGWKPKTHLAWVVGANENQTAHVVALPKDPIKALRGSLKDLNLWEEIQEERQKDKERE